MRERFQRGADFLSYAAGSPWAIIAAITTVLLWTVGGLVLGFTDLWLLVINTITTIVTFLLVFLIQAATNRQSKAVLFKLDELIEHLHEVPSRSVAAEKLPEQELDQMIEGTHGDERT